MINTRLIKKSEIILPVLFLLFINLFAENGTDYSNNIELAWKNLKTKKYAPPSQHIRKKMKKYDHLIEYFASLNYTRANYNVNSNYLRALIAAESGGQPQAVSEDGAIGLTQIIYSSAIEWAEKLAQSGYDFKYIQEEKLNNLKKEDLFDPAINILICAYITDVHNKKFGGELATTVAAWNAGQYAVSDYKGIPPYEETLNLISKVEIYLHYFNSN